MTTSRIDGVLFDFSGTLLRVVPTDTWLRSALDEAGLRLPEEEQQKLAEELVHFGALPGGPAPRALPAELEPLWHERDTTAENHRAAYTALIRRAALPDPALADLLYDRHLLPESWRPYPDAREVLDALRDAGIPVAVVSNVGWDIRPVFRAHGLDAGVGTYVLSFEYELQKPAAGLFEVACRALDRAPERVLMVGDDRVADGGATALGCALHLVDHLPVDERPHGLRPVLDLVG